MANCSICGNKIGMLGGKVIFDNGDYVFNTCDNCAKLFNERVSAEIKQTIMTNTDPADVVAEIEFEQDAAGWKKLSRAMAEDYYKKNPQMLKAKTIKQSIEALKNSGVDGYWEYKAVKLADQFGGGVDLAAVTNQLNELGVQGWRLKVAYTNELGKNALAVGGVGVNSTADENIFIFERYHKF